MIGAFIDENPEARDTLMALQAQIDGLRATAGTPARALSGIAGLLGERLDALSSQLLELRQETDRLRALVGRRRA